MHSFVVFLQKYNEKYSGGSVSGSGDANKSQYNSLVNDAEMAAMDRIYQEEHAAL
jgi:hypothetical protein